MSLRGKCINRPRVWWIFCDTVFLIIIMTSPFNHNAKLKFSNTNRPATQPSPSLSLPLSLPLSLSPLSLFFTFSLSPHSLTWVLSVGSWGVVDYEYAGEVLGYGRQFLSVAIEVHGAVLEWGEGGREGGRDVASVPEFQWLRVLLYLSEEFLFEYLCVVFQFLCHCHSIHLKQREFINP